MQACVSMKCNTLHQKGEKWKPSCNWSHVLLRKFHSYFHGFNIISSASSWRIIFVYAIKGNPYNKMHERHLYEDTCSGRFRAHFKDEWWFNLAQSVCIGLYPKALYSRKKFIEIFTIKSQSVRKWKWPKFQKIDVRFSGLIVYCNHHSSLRFGWWHDFTTRHISTAWIESSIQLSAQVSQYHKRI